MRRIATILLAASALSAGGVQAAIGAPAIRASTYNWTGFYVGASVGGAWGHTDVSRLDNAFLPVQSSPNGVALGGLLGYNLQSGSSVFGLEGDAGWMSAKASTSGFTTAAFMQTSRIDFEGRIRGRLGYAMDRTLPFVAGGVSFGHQKLTIDNLFLGTTMSLKKIHTGWNIGGGLDYVLLPGWIGRIEYIYDQFSAQDYIFGAPAVVADRSVKFNTSTVRAALIYKLQ
jgi:outer membrane immunogenic protein